MTDSELTEQFQCITDLKPLRWQSRLFHGWLARGRIPSACDLPTGTGKTSVMALWYIARRAGSPLPRRLIYVVDRRAVVDQATEIAEQIKQHADDNLRISTLRGQHLDNREWLSDPKAPAIVVGTVDMVGSRLLFSGYGVSRKMRPMHAGLLGADTLFILDEAHLTPPFEALLAQIESDRDTFGPRAAEHRAIVPPLRLLSLSATGRRRDGEVFALEPADLRDEFVSSVVNAEKLLTLHTSPENELSQQMADKALHLAMNNGPARCLIYADSREDARATATLIQKKYNRVALLVGARRLREREDEYARLKNLGFIAGSPKSQEPTFLVATSAGEVGVDLDADHLICDLVPWERMVQRLGRVNRRGGRSARVIVFAPPGPPEKPTPRAAAAWAVLEVLPLLPKSGNAYAAGPAALSTISERARTDQQIRAKLDAATTPPPLRPALDRPTLEAWSLTSLASHPGRPDVAPWLRGWDADDPPQTRVIWRSHLPVRDGEQPKKDEIEQFFEAAPPRPLEILETESWRVADWLMNQAAALSQRLSRLPSESQTPGLPARPSASGATAFVLDAAGQPKDHWTLPSLTYGDKTQQNRRTERMIDSLSNATLIVDARLGGLRNGLLDTGAEGPVSSADGDNWGQEVGFRIRLKPRGSELDSEPGWSERYRFLTRQNEDEQNPEALVVEMWRDDSANEDDRSEAERPQKLDDHQNAVAAVTRVIAAELHLPLEWARVLEFAARHHDAGKAALAWQRAFNARPDGPYAKTRGPIRFNVLNGYRHELGSLLRLADSSELASFTPAARALALHLIAAHHGHSRPLLKTQGCEDAPPSALLIRAREIALRFAELQNHWGPWGLAWWEALLRAADQQASANLFKPDSAEAAPGARQ